MNLDLKKTFPPPPSPRRWRSPGCAGLELLCGVRRSPLDLMSRGGRSLFALDWPGEPPGEGPGGSRISDVQALPVSYPCLHAVTWLSGFHALTWEFLFFCSEIAPRPPLVPSVSRGQLSASRFRPGLSRRSPRPHGSGLFPPLWPPLLRSRRTRAAARHRLLRGLSSAPVVFFSV